LPQWLAGRAWFNVKHEGRPFSAEAMNGVTRDIGTAFEVAREDRAVEIGVAEGRIASACRIATCGMA
jgi:transmembrane sensor